MVFRLGAVLLGLTPLVLAEVSFRILDWGRPSYHGDPFAGFSAVYPLFVLDNAGERYEIPPSRQVFFYPDSFASKKAANEFRIFCLGGSTVQGRPFAIETSFSSWLELSLEAAAPERHWDVLNCGGVSYASYRLVPILKEVLQYGPDLIVLYTGHNEFLEERTYHHIKYRPKPIARFLESVAQLRTVTLLRKAVHDWGEGSAAELPPAQPTLQAEVDTLLDYRGGLEQYHRNEKWRLDVIEHFRYNLYRMVQLCRDAKVPLLLVNPVSNLRDCPPFKSLHREDLTAEELEQFELLWTTAKRYFKSNKFLAAEYLEQAIALDDQFAGIYYELGTCYDNLGMLSRAKEAFLQAKELDVCPLRILEPMNEIVLEIARRTETPLVDVRRMFETLTDGGIPGNDWLLDHAHPSIFGHQRIAAALMKELIRQGVVRPGPGWPQERERKFREHFTSLGDIYFAQGMQRLDSLRTWTEGRGFKTRPDSKETELGTE